MDFEISLEAKLAGGGEREDDRMGEMDDLTVSEVDLRSAHIYKNFTVLRFLLLECVSVC